MVRTDGKIGRYLARLFSPRDGLDSIRFPLGTPPEIRRALVEEMNDLAGVGKNGVPYAVEISASPTSNPWTVHPKVAEEYRAGSRLFVWEEGSYDSSASFSSAVSMLLDRDFPSPLGSQRIIDGLASQAVKAARRLNVDALHPGEWDVLEASTADVFLFVAQVMSLSGNEALESWCAAWWRFADVFASRLEKLFSGLEELPETSNIAYAIAGLPRPSGRSGYSFLQPKKYLAALNEHWSTSDDIANSCRVLCAIRAKEDLGQYPLEHLNVGDMDELRNALGHTVLAITSLEPSGANASLARIWGGVPEKDWLITDDSSLELRTVQLGSLELPLLSEQPRPTFLVPSVPPAGEHWHQAPGGLELIGVSVAFPIPEGGLTPLAGSLVIDCRPSSVDALIGDCIIDDGMCRVSINLAVGLRKKGKWPKAPVRLCLRGRDDIGLKLLGGNELEFSLLLLPPSNLAATVLAIGKGKRKRLVVCNDLSYRNTGAGPMPANENVDTYPLNLEDQDKVAVFCTLSVEAALPAELSGEGIQGEAHPDWTSLVSIEQWEPSDGDEIQLHAGERIVPLVEVTVGVDIPRPWLPIAAAASGVGPRPMRDAPPNGASATLRGELETALWKLLVDHVDHGATADKLGLGQGILPEGLSYSWHNPGLANGPEVPWLAQVSPDSRRIMHAGKGPSARLLATREAGDFWQALARVFDAARSASGEGKTSWISRCSLLPVGKEKIDAYLGSYSRLVKKAEEISHEDGFWARYPFSFLVVDASKGELKAILVSPLHPLRIGWLFGAEHAASASHRASHPASLLQVIEGWNFPWIGLAPAPEGNPAVLAAIPSEAGPERLFIGWSLLGAFNNSTGGSLSVPMWAAGKRLPGSASSGLSEGGISAALRDFTRVHPNLSTLSIDLYSASSAPRSEAIDAAITSAIAQLAGNNGEMPELLGGVRVYDSLNREGGPPISEEITGSGGVPVSAPVSWVRYNPDAPPATHIRFVENSNANVTRVSGKRMGWIPPLPVRRFAGLSGPELRDLNPVLDTGTGSAGWDAYVQALAAMEEDATLSSAEGAVSALRFQGGGTILGGSSTPRWTVTGNVQSSPAAIAREVAAHGQMLWEWRPGFLRRKSTTDVLGTRPYITVASVPKAFGLALANQLSLEPRMVDKILSTLGERGIGLASLMGMGTTHVSGALGFFLGYKMLGQLPTPDGAVARLVAPLDAVDGLLRAVTETDPMDETKRADLLIIDVFDSPERPVILRPVEIRCSPAGPTSFPSVGSDAVARKVEQLSQSISVARKAISEARLGQGSGEHSSLLARCAMAAIIECAWFLTPGQHDGARIAKVLASISSGTTDMEVGRSLVLWFQRTGAPQGQFHGDEPRPGVGTAFIDIDVSINSTEGQPDAFNDVAKEIASWLVPDSVPRAEGGLPAKKVSAPTGDDDTSVDIKVVQPDVLAELPAVKPFGGDKKPALPIEMSTTRPIVKIGKMADGTDVTWDPYHPKQRLTNGHVVVLGSSGSGKTQTLKAFVDQLSAQGVIPLMLDFNDDYVDQGFLKRLGARCFDGMDGLPFNPLEPELDSYSGKLNIQKQVFQVSGVLGKVYGLGVQQEATLRHALTTAYEEAGMLGGENETTIAPQFSRIGDILDEQGDKTVVNRLSPIFQLGLFRPGTTTLDELVSHPVVVRLSQLPNEEVKKAAAELILRSLYNTILHSGHSQSLKYVVVIDEAHKISNLGAVKTLLKEARKYGVCVVLSSQEARDFEDYVFANAGTLLSLKLSETNDSRRVAQLMVGAREAAALAEELRALPPFKGVLRNDHYCRPFARVEVSPYFKLVEQ